MPKAAQDCVMDTTTPKVAQDAVLVKSEPMPVDAAVVRGELQFATNFSEVSRSAAAAL